MDIIKVFGKNVKKYRTAHGISQELFAEKCGLHRTYISAIECYRRSISLENIQRVADALEIETYKLFLEDIEEEMGEFGKNRDRHVVGTRKTQEVTDKNNEEWKKKNEIHVEK